MNTYHERAKRGCVWLASSSHLFWEKKYILVRGIVFLVLSSPFAARDIPNHFSGNMKRDLEQRSSPLPPFPPLHLLEW